MKLFCRITALTLALLLLCLSASALEAPDFAALAEQGNVETHVGVTVTCPPRYALAECHGTEQYIMCSGEDGSHFVADYAGNVILALDSTVGAAELTKGNFVVASGGNGVRVYDITGKQLSAERYALQYDFDAVATGVGDEYVLRATAVTDRATGKMGCLLIYPNGNCFFADGIARFWQGVVSCWKDGKFGAQEPFGKTYLPYTYDYLEMANDGVLVCRKNGMYGLIDLEGKTVVPFEYDEMKLLRNDDYRRVAVRQGTAWGVIDLTGRVRVPIEHGSILETDFTQQGGTPTQWYLVRPVNIYEPGYYLCDDGAITLEGSPNIPRDTEILSDDRFLVRIPDTHLYELVDAQGQRLLDERIYYCDAFDGGYYMVVHPDSEHYLGRIYSEDLELKREFDNVATGDTSPTHIDHFKFYRRTDQALVIQRISPYRVEICTYDGELIDSRLDTFLTGVYNRCTIVLEYKKAFALGTADGRHFTPYQYSQPGAISLRDVESELVNVLTNGSDHLIHNTGTPMLNYDTFTGAHLFDECDNGGWFLVQGKTGFFRVAEPKLCFADANDADWFAKSVAFCVNAGLMRGVGNARFAPQTAMTRAMLVQVLYNLSGEACEPFGFEDVAENAWYADAVNWAAANEIVNGVSTERFAPDAPVTREQMVTILRRYALRFGEAEGRSDALEGFADRGWVSDYARDALCWAVTAGLINGRTPTTLEPQGQAKRAEIATVLMRFVNLMADKTRE